MLDQMTKMDLRSAVSDLEEIYLASTADPPERPTVQDLLHTAWQTAAQALEAINAGMR